MPPGVPPSVFLIDDSEQTCSWLSRYLTGRDDLRYLGCASTLAEGAEEVRSLMPDVLVLDFKMAGENTIAFIRALKARGLRPMILVYSGVPEKRIISDCIMAGAWGFLSKDAEPQELVAAIHKVDVGAVVFSETVRRVLNDA